MERIAEQTGLVDLMHVGRSCVIATAVLELDDGVALIDPGPASGIPRLRAGLEQAGIRPHDVRAVLLTHVHLDHAGATGTLLRQLPDVPVYVHERGVKHMIDPSRLWSSAARLFGNDMEKLWGECLPVPKANVHRVDDGDEIEFGSRRLRVAYTPGHASHHVSYFDERTKIAFVGDAAGGRILDSAIVLPATPPPDVDLDAIASSLDRIARWDPERLFLTHFGLVTNVSEHRTRLQTVLGNWSSAVVQSLEDPGDDASRARRFAEGVQADLAAMAPPEEVQTYLAAAPVDLSWYGLARYWRKRAEAAI